MLGFFLSAVGDVPELASRFQWLQPWDLDGPLAQKEKSRWLEQKRLREELEKRNEGSTTK